MWPFTKKINEENPKKSKILKRVVVGFVIGSAIASIVGKAILQEKRKEHRNEEDKNE